MSNKVQDADKKTKTSGHGQIKKKIILEKKQKTFLPLFVPNDNFKSKFDLIVMVCAIYNSFSIPFKVAF